MLAFLIAGPNIPFAVALTLLVAIFFLELAGLLFGASLTNLLGDAPGVDVDMPSPDIDIGAASKFLFWLQLGRVPVIILIVVFLAAFGVSGYAAQGILLKAFGTMLPSYLAAVLALILTLPLVRLFGRGLAGIIPKDETAAISQAELVGLRAVITIGAAGRDSPAEARATDRFGTTHYFMVEPDNPEERLDRGEPLLLIRHDGRLFFAIRHPEPDE